MKNHDSHVYLYAKNWYKCNEDIFVDLKKIYAIRNGMDVEYISNRNIVSCLLALVTPHIMRSSRMFMEFISDIDPKNVWRVNYEPKKEYDFEYAVAHKCLSVLALTKVEDIQDGLDEPDPKILPLRKKERTIA
jgi:hypothetical protein